MLISGEIKLTRVTTETYEFNLEINFVLGPLGFKDHTGVPTHRAVIINVNKLPNFNLDGLYRETSWQCVLK